MKKILALMLVALMAFSLFACAKETPAPAAVDPTPTAEAPVVEEPVDVEEPPVVEEPAETVAVMTYAEYIAADLDTEVTVETYVQAKQGWWADQATFYTQDEDGAYFIYNMPISEADYDLLVAGTKIRVTGYKAEWAGEIEIIDATFEIIDGNFIATALDATALLGTDELINHQNELVIFKGLTVEDAGNGDAFMFNWDGSGEVDNSDLYFNVSLDGATYTFTVEQYLTGPGTDVYEAVKGLAIGEVIDAEGFLYWYEGANPHITSVTVVG